MVVAALNGEIPGDYTESGSCEALPDSSRQRIMQALDLILKIGGMPRGRSGSWDRGVIAEFDELFARYPMVFRAEMGILGFPQFIRRPGRQRVDAHEAVVMESLLGLAQGGISKLHRCTCERWYFAKRSDQKSCSVACRKRKHEQTSEYKKRKAARARAAYSYHFRK